MIVSFFDGRVRIRREELKNPETMDLVAGLIRSQSGILKLFPNLRTGSLVVIYDSEKIPRETIQEIAVMLEKQVGPVTRKEKSPQKARSRTFSPLEETGFLAGFYTLTLLSGFIDKRAHVAFAMLFTGFTAAHVYIRRRLL